MYKELNDKANIVRTIEKTNNRKLLGRATWNQGAGPGVNGRALTLTRHRKLTGSLSPGSRSWSREPLDPRDSLLLNLFLTGGSGTETAAPLTSRLTVGESTLCNGQKYRALCSHDPTWPEMIRPSAEWHSWLCFCFYGRELILISSIGLQHHWSYIR